MLMAAQYTHHMTHKGQTMNNDKNNEIATDAWMDTLTVEEIEAVEQDPYTLAHTRLEDTLEDSIPITTLYHEAYSIQRIKDIT